MLAHNWNGYEVQQREDDGYVCLNDMNLANTRAREDIYEYLRLPRTQEYLDALSVDLGIIKFRENPGVLENTEKALVLTTAGRNGSTWVHPEVAIDFASFISVPFRIWANRVLRDVIYKGGHISGHASSEQLVALQAQCEQQQKKILALQSQNKSQAKRSEERRLLNVKRSDEARKAREERDRQKRRGDAYEAECKMWQRWVTNTQKTVDKMKKEFSKHQDANGRFQVDRIYQEMYSQITTRR